MLVAAMVLGACRAQSPPPPPDILLVVLDTVRADRLAAYGHHRPTSSQLEAIAAAGALFEDTTAPSSWTWPSHATLFTGQPPWVHGAHATRDPAYAVTAPGRTSAYRLTPLREDLPTLAGALAGHGYRTVALSSNHLLHPELGLTRGFEDARCGDLDSAVVDEAVLAMAEDDGRPLLLFVNLMSAHSPFMLAPEVPWSAQHRAALDPVSAAPWATPYLIEKEGIPGLDLTVSDPARGLLGEQAYAAGDLHIDQDELGVLADLYDGDLVRLDNALMHLVRAWTGSGRGGGVVAVVSDHGEYLGEHGQIGHGRSLYREAWSVPMVLAAPGRIDQGQRVRSPVSLQQLQPTLLALAGIETSEPTLLPVIEGAAGPDAILAAVWGQDGPALPGDIGGGWRMVRKGTEALLRSETGRLELYDLGSDPAMQRDLATERPQRVMELSDLLAPSLEDAEPHGAPIKVGTGTLEQLEALGYVSAAP